MYHIRKSTALTRLERNIKRKWVDDLSKVDLFLERIRERDKDIKPTSLFFFDSESYFEHLLLWKIGKEMELLRPKHFIKPKRHKKILAWSIKTIR